MRAPFRAAGGLLLLLLCPAAAAGQDEDPRTALPERPSVATHAYTVAPGIAELELGFERARSGGRFAGAALPATVKLGLARRVQLTASTALDRPDAGRPSVSTVDLGMKWRFADRVPLVGALAVLPSVSLSTPAVEASGETAAGLLLISSRSLGAVSLDLNVGRTWRTGDGATAPRQETLWAVSSGGPVRGRVGWLAELHGYPAAAGPAGRGTIVNTMMGSTVAVSSRVTLDAAVRLPLADEDDAAVFTGVVWNVGRFWTP